MPVHNRQPVRIPAPGEKLIEEHIGRASTGSGAMSVARMVAPAGWDEPFQTPAFDEVTIVLQGTMRVEHASGATDVAAGEAVLCPAGERIRYSNPSGTEECVYWAVCAPAFSPDAANRED